METIRIVTRGTSQSPDNAVNGQAWLGQTVIISADCCLYALLKNIPQRMLKLMLQRYEGDSCVF